MNRILKALRDAGYKGGATDQAAIRQFLADNNITEFLVGAKKLAVDDIVSEAAKPVTLKLTGDDASDTKSIDDDQDDDGKAFDGDDDDAEPNGFHTRKKTIKKTGDDRTAKSVVAPFRGQSAAIQDRRNQKSAYVSRMKRFGVGAGDSQVAFSDADVAEAFAAYTRLAIAGLSSYAEKANDEEIVVKSGIVSKTALTTTFTAAGALVPNDFSSEYIEIVLAYGAARQVCPVLRMSRDVLQIPRETADPTAYWTGEGVSITASDQAFDRVNLVAQKLASLHRISSELMNDSAVDVSSTLARGIARAQAYKEDLAYFLGDGTSTYGGNVGWQGKFAAMNTNIEDAAGLQQATGDLITEIVATDIDGVYGRSYDWSGMSNNTIVCHKRFFWRVLVPLMDRGEIATTGRAAGTSMADRASAPPRTFRGDPVVFSNVMSAYDSGTTGRDKISMLYGDFGLASKMGEVAGGLNVAMSDQESFASDLITVRSTNRVAINVHDIGDNTNPGPVVGLVMKDS